MAAGLPGTGVGGLFLILSALLMPLVELRRRARGRSGRSGWLPVGRHAALAMGMIAVVTAAIGAVHWALFASSPTHSAVSARSAGSAQDVAAMAPPVEPVLMTLLLLGGILGIAYTLRLILHRPAKGVSEDVEAARAERSDSQAVRRAASTPQLTRSS